MQTLQALLCLILLRFVYVNSAKDAQRKPIPLEISKETGEETDELIEDSRKSGADEMWPWDVWCQLQPIIVNQTQGKCSTRYYYDRQIDECRPYKFRGLMNKNSFQIKENCERYCSKSAYAVLNFMKVDAKLTCALQYDAGLCFSLPGTKSSLLWYYNINEKRCKSFTHSGCGGNNNRWRSRYACWRACSKTTIPTLRLKEIANGTFLRKNQGNVGKILRKTQVGQDKVRKRPLRKINNNTHNVENKKQYENSKGALYDRENVNEELNFNSRRRRKQ